MNIRNAACTTALLVLTVGVSLSADRVRLRSGKAIDGLFIGGDSKSVRVLLDNGQVAEARLEDVLAVEISARKPAAATAGETCRGTRRGTRCGSKPGTQAGTQGGDRARRYGAERAHDAGDRRGRLAGRHDLQRHRG